MCFMAAAAMPAWMSTLSTVASVVSTGMQVVSAFSGSSSNKNAYEYQAAVNRNNAMIAEWNAQDVIRQGQQEEDDMRRKAASLKGSQRASLAARGLDISEGSALNILSDTDMMTENDAITIKNNTNKKAWAYRVQGNNDTANAELLQMRADSESPLMAGGGALLSGLGTVADRWYASKGKLA